jgi:hypothetical protein
LRFEVEGLNVMRSSLRWNYKRDSLSLEVSYLAYFIRKGWFGKLPRNESLLRSLSLIE